MPATFPAETPAAAFPATGDSSTPVACVPATKHPLFGALSEVRLHAPVRLRCTPGAEELLRTRDGLAVAAGKERFVFVGGMPVPEYPYTVTTVEYHERFESHPDASDAYGELLTDFSTWCGVTPGGPVVSRFEHAVIVQNPAYADATDSDWVGAVEHPAQNVSAIQEVRTRSPWPAFRSDTTGTRIEGLALRPGETKILKLSTAAAAWRLKGVPESMSCRLWLAGVIHPIIGRFDLAAESDLDPRLIAPDSVDVSVHWFVAKYGGKKLDSGRGPRLRTGLPAGENYLLAFVRTHHPEENWYPVCTKYRC